MDAPSILSEKSPNTGRATGAWSSSRVIAWLMILPIVAGWTLYYRSIYMTGKAPADLGLKELVIASAVLGILSAGFYSNRAGGAFDKIAEAIAKKVGS